MKIHLRKEKYKQLEYFIAGKGALVLFLHGIGADPRLYKGLIFSLAKSYTVIAPSLPGHGNSKEMVIVNDDFNEYILLLHNLVSHLEFKDKLVIVGHSFGGALAIRYLKAYPSEVRKIVLVDPLLKGIDLLRLENRFNELLDFLDCILHGMRIPLASIFYYLKNYPAFIRTAKIIRKDKFMNDIEMEENSNVKVFWGENDHILPIQDSIPYEWIRSNMVVIRGKGHNWLMYYWDKIVKYINI